MCAGSTREASWTVTEVGVVNSRSPLASIVDGSSPTLTAIRSVPRSRVKTRLPSAAVAVTDENAGSVSSGSDRRSAASRR